jgi:hypothetical protein
MEMETLLASSLEHDEHKEDFVLESEDFYWDTNMDVRFRQMPLGHTEPVQFGMTDWALKQACRKHSVPYKYATRCPDHLAATNLNWWREHTDRRFMLRTYDSAIRGYLSSRYHPIPNSWLLGLVVETLEGVPYQLVQSRVTPDNMHIKMLVADTVGSNVAVGVYVNNGEIGDYKVRVHPLIMVTECTNSIIFQDGFEHFHVNINEAQMRVQIKAALGEALQKSPEYIQKMMKAEEKELPAISTIVEGMCKQYNLSQTVHDDILIGTRGHETVLGLANGLSYAAQKVEDDRTRIDMEITAGRTIMNAEALQFQTIITEPEE